MKTLKTFINEKLQDLVPSTDPIKQALFDSLKNIKILWKVSSVDGAFEEVDPSWARNYAQINIPKNAKVYCAKVWNGGDQFDENSSFNCGAICAYKNNTDKAWYFVIDTKTNTYDVWKWDRKYYGMNTCSSILAKNRELESHIN